MSVAEGLTAAKAGVDLAKRLMDTLNRPDVDVHGVRGQLQEMLIHVVNAQVALAEAQMEISELRQKVEDRNALRSINETLEFAEDVY